MNALKDILIKKRKELGLSLRKASDLIGISHSYLSTLEKGIDPRTGSPVNPTPETLRLISKAYNIDYEELMQAAGYLKKYENIDEKILKDEDFKRVLPLILKHITDSILKYHNVENDPFSKKVNLSELWDYLDDDEKSKLLNSVIKEVKYNKATGNISLTQYFEITEESYHKIKQEYLKQLSEEESSKNIRNPYKKTSENKIIKDDENEYKKEIEFLEKFRQEMISRGYDYYKDKTLEELADIVVKHLKIQEILDDNNSKSN